jgi:2-hydroxychromene-2-carboxylate isomerase
MRAEDAAARAGMTLAWRPFNVREIMIEQNNVPFRGKPVKARYMWRDIERRAGRHGLPFAGEPPYPVDPDLLANRVGTVAAIEGWCPSFTRALYRDWFLDRRAPGDAAGLSAILRGLGRDADAVLAAADGPAVRQRYAAETDAARSLGIFGSPSFVADGEVFWGDDRMEDAFDWALGRRPGIS